MVKKGVKKKKPDFIKILRDFALKVENEYEMTRSDWFKLESLFHHSVVYDMIQNEVELALGSLVNKVDSLFDVVKNIEVVQEEQVFDSSDGQDINNRNGNVPDYVG